MSGTIGIFGRGPGRLVEPLSGRHWDQTAIEQRGRQRLASYEGRRLVPGDRVFIHFENTLELFPEILALWHLGACVVPIDPSFTEFEIETLARCARPRFSLWLGSVDAHLADTLSALGTTVLDATDVDPPDAGRPIPASALALDADALILFTSGTTGRPKGVVHTHRSLRARWTSLEAALGLTAFQRTLCLLPTHFGHGLICNALFPWLAGQDLFVVPPFQPTLVARLGSLIDDHGITCFSSVPALWRLALKIAPPPQRGSLRRVICGSAPLSAALWTKIQDWAGTRDVLNAYGITETASWLAGTTGADGAVADGLIGEPWGARVKILRSEPLGMRPDLEGAVECEPGETGRIWVCTPALMRGYLDREDLTSDVLAEGWFSTGDLGCLDDRGWLHLRGREREEINKGGIKIHPEDVDAVVDQFVGTLDTCCFAYQDALLGENVGIAVVVKDASPATARALREWTRQRLASHQMPVRWYFVHAIPRSSRGKIDRARMSEICAGLRPVDFRDATE